MSQQYENILKDMLLQNMQRPAQTISSNPETQALIDQRVQEGLAGPKYDYSSMANTLAQFAVNAPSAPLRTAGMSTEQVNQEYAKTDKLLDRQLASFLSSSDKANMQQAQMFDQALKIKASDLATQRAERMENAQYLHLLMQSARDRIQAGRYASDLRKEEKQIALLDSQIEQTKANTERLRNIARERIQADRYVSDLKKEERQIELLEAQIEQTKANTERLRNIASGPARVKLSASQQAAVDYGKSLLKNTGLDPSLMQLMEDPQIAGAVATASKLIDDNKTTQYSSKESKDKAKLKEIQAILLREGQKVQQQNAQTQQQQSLKEQMMQIFMDAAGAQ